MRSPSSSTVRRPSVAAWCRWAIAASRSASDTRSAGESPTPAGLVLVELEVGLAGAAHGAEPVVGDVLEGGAGRDAAVRVAVGGVVDEPAGLADPLLRRGRRHGQEASGGAGR